MIEWLFNQGITLIVGVGTGGFLVGCVMLKRRDRFMKQSIQDFTDLRAKYDRPISARPTARPEMNRTGLPHVSAAGVRYVPRTYEVGPDRDTEVIDKVT